MSRKSIFPVREEVDRETSPETVSLDDAGDVVEALTSGTARELVDRVYEQPATTSDLAAATDTSLQNARYHLNRLEEVGVVEVVDTWYSKRGKDMEVYGPANEPLVIVAGGSGDESEVERAMAESSAAGRQAPTVRPDGGTDTTVRDGS